MLRTKKEGKDKAKSPPSKHHGVWACRGPPGTSVASAWAARAAPPASQHQVMFATVAGTRRLPPCSAAPCVLTQATSPLRGGGKASRAEPRQLNVLTSRAAPQLTAETACVLCGAGEQLLLNHGWWQAGWFHSVSSGGAPAVSSGGRSTDGGGGAQFPN